MSCKHFLPLLSHSTNDLCRKFKQCYGRKALRHFHAQSFKFEHAMSLEPCLVSNSGRCNFNTVDCYLSVQLDDVMSTQLIVTSRSSRMRGSTTQLPYTIGRRGAGTGASPSQVMVHLRRHRAQRPVLPAR